jgi:streptogramin lyase
MLPSVSQHHGWQQVPVSGLIGVTSLNHVGPSIYLFSFHPTERGEMPVSLLVDDGSGVVQQDSYGNGYIVADDNGNFDITGLYAAQCPTATAPIYMLALGGNIGYGLNPSYAGVSAFPVACSQLPNTNFVTVNELTTIAAAYAFSSLHFRHRDDEFFAPDTSEDTLNYMFAVANDYVNGLYGSTNSTTSDGGTVPVSTLNSLADILTTCTQAPNAGCQTLFSTVAGLANSSSSLAAANQPTDTFMASVQMAQNPTNYVAGIYGLLTNSVATGTPTYTPFLSTQPTDWTLPISYATTPTVSVNVVSSSENPSSYGDAVTLTAQAVLTYPAGTFPPGSPTGDMCFYNGSTLLGCSLPSSWQRDINVMILYATLQTSTLPAGTDEIMAVYVDNGVSTSSTAFAQTVNQATAVVTMTPSSNPIASGAYLTLTVSVAPSNASSGGRAPSGTVTIYDGTDGIPLASPTLSGGTGTATFSTASLAGGQYSLYAVYSGDPNYAAGALSTALIETITTTSTAEQGSAYGGQQPVSGAHVYLYAANTTGYGGNGISPINCPATNCNSSISLLNSSVVGPNGGVDSNGNYYVVTGVDGSFNITGDYTCTAGQQVYAYAIGGDPGYSGVNNAAGFLAILGNCPSSGTFAGTGLYIWMNEVSTVAAAYAMSGFASDATHVSSSGTALAKIGIQNAFANAANLASLRYGTVLTTTPSGNGTVPQAAIETLANILASCVNSDGSTGSGTTCGTLFSNATSNGTISGTQPTDTATAAIHIAHNPVANVTALYTLPTANPPFPPGQLTQPNDYTLNIVFGTGSSGGCTSICNPSGPPNGVAIDGSGNVWATNYSESVVTEFSSAGATIASVANASNSDPAGVAIDQSGNAWVVSSPYLGGQSSLQVFSSNGTTISTVGTTRTGGLDSPTSVALDVAGNAWVSNNAVINNNEGSVSAFTSMLFGFRNPVLTTLYEANGIATDSSDYIWVSASNNVVKLSSAGVPVFSTTVTSSPGGLYSIAMDGLGDAWMPNAKTNSVMEVSSTGAILSPSGGYTGGGLNVPTCVSIDGAGNVWVASAGNFGSNSSSITELSNSGTTLSGNGYVSAHAGLGQIAIDGSGNAWLPGEGIVVEYIGIAAPVVTPLATAVVTSKLGTRP